MFVGNLTRLKMKKIICIGFMLISIMSFAQTNSYRRQRFPRNSVYLELGGIGKAMYSVNYDRVLAYSQPFSLSLKVGLMFPSQDSEDAFRKEYTFPTELNIRAGNDGFVEFGLGQVFTPNETIPSYEAPPYFRLGLRSTNEDGAVLFRISLVNNLLQKEFKPQLAYAIGYSF